MDTGSHKSLVKGPERGTERQHSRRLARNCYSVSEIEEMAARTFSWNPIFDKDCEGKEILELLFRLNWEYFGQDYMNYMRQKPTYHYYLPGFVFLSKFVLHKNGMFVLTFLKSSRFKLRITIIMQILGLSSCFIGMVSDLIPKLNDSDQP